MILPIDEEEIKLKKRNRARKLSPKKHKIVHESGRSTKTLWKKIIEGVIKK
ncbi:hypothetical protein HYU92_05360 [Candidatus Curtissbacteria bacterium]|nr:hypothetical protein [Candidatus Curtissbacteria bacterium]